MYTLWQNTRKVPLIKLNQFLNLSLALIGGKFLSSGGQWEWCWTWYFKSVNIIQVEESGKML